MTATEVTITSRNHVSVVSVPMGGVRSVNGAHGDVTLLADDIPITDAGSYYTATDIEGALQEIGAGGIGGGGGTAASTTFTPTGTISATDVQAAIAEVSGDVTAEAASRASADTTLTSSLALKAPLASPTFTGTVTVPSGAVLATPASLTLTNATGLPESGVTGLVADLALKSPLASPTFTGTVTIPTGASLGTPASLTLTNATGLPESGVTNLTADLALKAPLASPTFTGHVTVPTPSSSTDATTKSYVDGLVSTVPTFRGVIDCSANPNYPSATGGDSYVCSVGGKVGGGSGKTVVAGDVILASSTNAGGTEASVGTSWIVLHSGSGAALTSGTLAQFAATTSAQLAGVISDETGTGALVFGTSPTLTTPNLGTPSALTLTNATGLPQSGVTNLVTDLAAKKPYGTPVSWDGGAGDYTVLSTDTVIYQDSDTLSGTTLASLPAISSLPADNDTIIIADRGQGASSATPITIGAHAGDTITNAIYLGVYVAIYTAGGARQLTADKSTNAWTAVDVVLDPDPTFGSPSDSVAPTQNATYQFVNSAIDALDDIAGGTNINIDSAAGVSTFDLTDDVTMTTGTVSGGTLSSGKIVASHIHLSQTYTQTSDPVSPLGSQVLVDWNPTLNYAGSGFSGPLSQAGYFGPSGVFHIQGTVTQKFNASATGLGLGPVGMTHQLIFKNDAGQARTLSPSWGFISGPIYVADGATVTAAPTDMHLYNSTIGVASGYINGGASFVDNMMTVTKNSGTWNGTTNSIEWASFLSIPMFSGSNTSLTRRIGFDVNDATVTAGNLSPVASVIGGTPDSGAATITEQIGVRVKRLANATRNVGIQSNSPIELWADTNTLTATMDSGNALGSNASQCALGLTGTHTFNYSTPSMVAFSVAGTWTFATTANAFTAFAAFKAAPTIQNAASVTSFGANTMMSIAPTYNLDATSAVTVGATTGLSVTADLSRSAGSQTITTTDLYGMVVNLKVNGGNTVQNRHGLRIEDPTGSGTVVNNIGIEIPALAKGTTLNLGISNLSSSVMGGTIYGSTSGSGNLSLSATTNATKGDIQLNNPTTEWFVTDATYTGASLRTLFMDANVTMNASGGGAGTGNQFIGIYQAPTVIFQQAGFALGNFSIFDGTIYKNHASSGAIALGAQYLHRLNPTYRADTSAITISNVVGIQYAATIDRTNSGTMAVTNYIGYAAAGPIVWTGASVTNRYGLYVENIDISHGGTVTNNYGIYVNALSGGSTGNVSISVQGTAPNLFSPKTALGGQSTPTWNAHVQGGNAATTALGLDVSTTSPTAPGSSASGVISVYKGTGGTNVYLLVTYNDGGTTRYRYMNLNSTTATWTHATTLPT